MKLFNRNRRQSSGPLVVAFLVFASLYNFYTKAYAQETISGYDAKYDVVFNDSLAAAITKALNAHHIRGFTRTDSYHYFSFWAEFDTSGFADGIGLTSADTVKIWMEQYASDAVPSSSSTGFYELEDVGTVPDRELIATYDSTIIVDNPKTFTSFHGTGDPEISPGTWVRFFVQTIGGFTNGGLALKAGFFKQP